MPMKQASVVSSGIMIVVARTRGTTSLRTGFVASARSASIC